jgi:dTDP-4-dehydrorhamnose reductase
MASQAAKPGTLSSAQVAAGPAHPSTSILVTGAGGLLGVAVAGEAKLRGWRVHETFRHTLDVTDREACLLRIREAAPDAVIHCAAYTFVDRAEEEPEHAMALNRDATRNVVEATVAAGGIVVYPSTDYVFDGRATLPYRPDEVPNPLGVYGASKAAGEAEIRLSRGGHLVVRTSWLYGGGGRNFVDTVRTLAAEGRELRVVADQRGRPTWSRSLARTILNLVERGVRGTVHACDAGDATWFELAEAVIRIAGLRASLTPITTAEHHARAPRPAYSVLDLSETEALLDHPLPHWRHSLETYLGGRT